jgi:cytochrome b involved in lipid metabolism
MIELALLMGLGAVGYLLAIDQPKSVEEFSSQHAAGRPTMQINEDEPMMSQESKGHSNEVPYFGANVTQSTYSGATNHILDNHAGAGKEYFQKTEVRSFFDAKPGTGQPFGNPNESDFLQSRMVSGQNMKNVFPVDQVHVGPGGNDGYTNIPKGGFQQDQYREYALPKTTDELRVVSKPKLTYEPPMIKGQNNVTVPGVQADVKKNKPDRFVLLGHDRVNTAVGAQTAPRLYAEQPIKPQARDTTEKEYFGPSGGMDGVMKSYIRAFTEPFEEFMRLTAEGRPGPAGAQGTGVAIGGDMYSAQTKKDEDVLSEASRFNSGMVAMNATAQDLGSYRYKEPLQQDIHVDRNGSDMLKAFNDNPYSQKLNAF